jgi:GntR family transcriptional regulator / MocR family aminotransferase
VRKANAVYLARRTLILNSLRREFGEHLQPVRSFAGIHLAALARRASVAGITSIVQRASDAGVAVQELSHFTVTRPPLAGIVLGFGAIATDRVEEGLRRLRACFGDA